LIFKKLLLRKKVKKLSFSFYYLRVYDDLTGSPTTPPMIFHILFYFSLFGQDRSEEIEMKPLKPKNGNNKYF